MNILKKLLLTVSLLSITSLALADNKVVVLDMQAAMMGTNLAKKSIDDLKNNADFTSMRAKVQSLVSDIKAAQKKADKEAMAWSDDQKEEHRKKIDYMRADYKLARQKLQAEQQDMLKKVQKELAPKVRPVLEKMIKEEKIGIIINANSVFHADADHDITAELVKRLNKATK